MKINEFQNKKVNYPILRTVCIFEEDLKFIKENNLNCLNGV